MTGVVIDLDERKRAEEELRRAKEAAEAANRELESFSYSVSHDLRAPLRAIDGFAQALAEEYGERLDATGRGYLERVRAGAQRLGRLIDDLLRLARLSRLPLERRRVDLSALARELAEELAEREPERTVRVAVADGLAAEADPRLVRVALEDLLGNAWKITRRREDATIEVGVENGAGEAVFFVRDNGAGFDMAYAGKLFGAFQRLHSEREFEGSGVGLATVARVVRRHGGRIDARGEVGRGATFSSTLDEPAAPPREVT
jgi:light-regulated signal transduction histidine kinase (bacteriophytochrome)